MKKGFLILFLFFMISCGQGKSGVVLRVTTETPLSPASKSISSKTLSAAIGDAAADGFPDRFLTPSAFTVAFKSFRLIERVENIGQGQTPPSYIVFDSELDPTHIVELKTGQIIEVAENETTRAPQHTTVWNTKSPILRWSSLSAMNLRFVRIGGFGFI